jgi:serine/threonine protein kinase
MVTGRVPFDGPSPSDVMQKHLRTPLVPPDQLVPQLSSGLSMVVEMMMAKDPRERYSSAVDLIEDLDRVQAGESPVHARPKFEAALSGAGAAAAGEGTAGFDGDETFAAFPQAGSSRGPAPWSSPMGIALLVGLGVSLAANAAMALLLLVRR